MIKNGKKFISALLAVVLITTVFPISTYAAETENSDDIQVSEVEESRDLYSKTICILKLMKHLKVLMLLFQQPYLCTMKKTGNLRI